MAKINGGIIGPNNPTGPFSAGGVWRLEDAFNAQKAGTWPVVLGYQIPNSARFNSGSTDYLQRTPASAGSLTTWTYSFWTKRSKLATAEQYLSAGPRSSPNVEDQIYSISTDAINWYDGTANANVLRTTQLFRDVSAWYHLMFVWDTTNATAGNRARIYVNGTEVTSFSIDNNPSQNAVSKINGTGQHRIGQTGTVAGENLDGYLAEVIFIDGQALTPSSFGQTDSTTGIWTPIAYTGTYGTNGFYLNFANSADLGNDVSGNNNDWTVNGLTSIDQSYDSPTNNFATLNPLRYTGNLVSFAEGNLKATALTDGNEYFHSAYSSIGVTKGKWYAEFKCAVGGSPDNDVIVGGGSLEYTQDSGNQNGIATGITMYNGVGQFYVDGVTSSGLTTYTAGDIIGIYLNVDDGQISFYKNGSQISTTRTLTTTASNGITYFIVIVRDLNVFSSWEANFGNAPFTISSGNADANGFGNFEYAVPSGYYALCSKNLALYG